MHTRNAQVELDQQHTKQELSSAACVGVTVGSQMASSSACQMRPHAESALQWLENAMFSICYWNICVHLFFSIVVNFDIDCRHVCSISLCRLCACACWLLMVDLHITGRLLVGMGKKLRPVELCSYTLACKCGRCGLLCTTTTKPGGVLLSL